MNTWFNKYFRIIIMLALAVSPLHGLLASPITPNLTANSSMLHMQHEMPSPSAMGEMQDREGHGSMQECDHCCDDCSCEHSCATCVHFTLAILGSDLITDNQHQSGNYTGVIDNLLERSVLPLLQPPISKII